MLHFRKELQFIGSINFIKGRRGCVQPLRSRLEANKKLKPPTTVKDCRCFVGMVTFLGLFHPDLQKLLKSIYCLTRKGRFIWEEEQQNATDKIKRRLQKPPILSLPDNKGRFHLNADTSTFVKGSNLYQIQNGKPKLITYMSKGLLEAAQNYSLIELELCGLAIK